MRLLNLLMLSLLLAACATTQPTAATRSSLLQVYCALASEQSYAWDEDAETADNRIDTLETINPIRLHNAKYRKYCQ